MKTLIIIPTYNEAENLSPLLQTIFSYAPLNDVLIVDDRSPDGTGELADELQKKTCGSTCCTGLANLAWALPTLQASSLR
jgi:glycosyltransferase involved in cell wall biosynthesis